MSAVRKFEHHPAVRKATPLLFAIVGPSASGKTFSSLRLATGMQKVTGGKIFLLDTEANRALAYSEFFEFEHVPFSPPHSPLDYLQAIEYCRDEGAKIIIVDSASLEHEGQGGVLEWHQAEVERLMKQWRQSADKVNFAAWQAPKAARRKLINAILQMNINFIFCFRAKEKIKVGKGEVTNLGFMPIAADEWIYEMTAKALLLPGAEGVPTWKPEEKGEKQLIKLPIQFRDLFSGKAGKPLDEETGEQLARWAAGDEADRPKQTRAAPKAAEPEAPSAGISDLVSAYEQCETTDQLASCEATRAKVWTTLSKADKQTLKDASESAKARVYP